jgi:hypothetical protein
LDEAPSPIPIEEYSKIRRMYTHDAPPRNEDILIMDSAADISCVGRGFKILFHSGEKTNLDMALVGAKGRTLDIVTAAAVVLDPTSSRNIIIIINQAAYVPELQQHESLLHTDQARHHNVFVNDLARCFHDVGGRPGAQSIVADGTTIPLKHDGSKYFLSIREPTEEDWNICQIIELTSPEPWQTLGIIRRTKLAKQISDSEVRVWSYRLGRLNMETTRRTLQATTQLVKSVEAENRVMPRRHVKCRLPCLRPKRLCEGFSSDTIFPETKSARGFTCAQVFLGEKSGYTYVVPLKNKAYAYTALQDLIRYVGAPAYMAVDAAREENMGEWLSICRTFCIPQHTSEPTYQNQNRVERRIQDVKRRATVLMSMHGTPSRYWDYAIEYAVEIINHTAVRRLDWRTPYEHLFGDTPDISVFRFTFFEPIYYLEPSMQFPQANMIPGRYLGIARTTGDAFTFIILPEKSTRGMCIHRSVIRSRDISSKDPYANYNREETDICEETENIFETDNSGKELNVQDGEEPDVYNENKSVSEDIRLEEEFNIQSMHHNEIIVDDTCGPQVITHAGDVEFSQENTSEIYDHFDLEHKCENIEDVIKAMFDEKDGKLYLVVRWTDGLESSIDAQMMQSDDPVRLARYIKDNPVEQLRSGFWSQWADKTLNAVSRSIRRIRRLYNNVDWKASSYPHSRKVVRRRKSYPVQMQSLMGVEVPRNTREALLLDKKNKNDMWKVAMKKEIQGIQDHGTFLFLPPGSKPPEGYQEAPLRMIFTVKSDLRRKARLVAGGHKVNADGHTSYSSVVRLDSIRLLNVIAKAQGLRVLAGDVGNAYLHAETKEKVYVRCGPEFGPELEGRIAIIKKSLYGLKSSGAQWHAHFAKTLHTMGFNPTRFDNDVWIKIRNDGSGYDYISTYVDDFLITAKDPWFYMKQLQEIYLIKEPKTPDFYLGATYTGDPEGEWSITAKDYIKEAIKQIEGKLGITIREEKTPIKTGDHPEEDKSPILDNVLHTEYQSIMGMLQWVVSLCRIDVCFAVSSLSRFCACPREGHLSRALRIWGYLKKYPSRSLSIKSISFPLPGETLDQDLINFTEQYAYAKEEIDPRFPRPMGKELDVSVFFDSDHAHDKVTGRSISGVIILVGSTPVVWRSKRQGAVQTSTYGAEFSAMRLATEEIIAMRYMLRSLGIKVSNPSSLSGDNAGVISNTSSPDATLKKKHIALSFHSVRENVSAGVVYPHQISSENNIADLLTKPLDRNTFMKHTGKVLSMGVGVNMQ